MGDKKWKFDNRLQRLDRSVGKFCRPVFQREIFLGYEMAYNKAHSV